MMKTHLPRALKTLSAMFLLNITYASSHPPTESFQQFLDKAQSVSSGFSSASSSASEVNAQSSFLPMVCLDPGEIKREMQAALNSAQEQIVVASPYISVNSLKINGTLAILQRKNRSDVRALALLSELTRSKPYEVKGIEALKEAGVVVRTVSKLHAKYILIDDHTLLVGSFNWLSGSLDPKNMYYQLNMMLKIEAPFVKMIQPHCVYISGKSPEGKPAEPEPITKITENFYVMSSTTDITQTQKHMLRLGKSTLEICSPNLNKNMLEVSGFLEILNAKVKEGVAVKVYTDSEMDKKKPDHRDVREIFKAIGVQLVEKLGIHTKWIIQDNKNLYVGSDNMFAGSGHHTGEGFWREFGVYMIDANDQIAEIKKHTNKIATIVDGINQGLEQTAELRTAISPREYANCSSSSFKEVRFAEPEVQEQESKIGKDALKKAIALATQTPLVGSSSIESL